MLIQTNKQIFPNTINRFMECRHNKAINYQKLLELARYSFQDHCSKLDKYLNLKTKLTPYIYVYQVLIKIQHPIL